MTAFEAVDSPYLAPFDGAFRVADLPTRPPDGAPSKRQLRRDLHNCIEQFRWLQRKLNADNRFAVLLIFQAMDAAGKDGTIRAVTRGVNPAGFQVHNFKKPSLEDLDHDFLWRTARRLPERGRIGVFNRSYYEEVLVVRVHPALLAAQRLTIPHNVDELWADRFEAIRSHERHLAENGTLVLKFWLNVSLEEQRERFLARLDEPDKRWKFSLADVEERQYWDQYMEAYEQAIAATSRPWAPWFAIPADNKRFARATVADIVVRSIASLGADYPPASDEVIANIEAIRRILHAEGP
jgi:PPK2 family polyphosphate:nucleotide phosphotransferase